MTDHATFLRAIIAAPDDDLPRLVYADYLDERGDPRGEFIRLQIALANGECDSKPCLTPDAPACYQCRRHRRERQLLRQHRWTWADFLFDDMATRECPACAEGGIYDSETALIECRTCDSTGRVPDEGAIEFRRGFVEEIACTWNDFCQHADAIRAATPLRRVRLTTRPNFASMATPEFNSEVIRSHPSMQFRYRGREYTLAREDTGRGVLPMLNAIWPGIEFELPPTPTIDAFNAAVTATNIVNAVQRQFVPDISSQIHRQEIAVPLLREPRPPLTPRTD